MAHEVVAATSEFFEIACLLSSFFVKFTIKLTCVLSLLYTIVKPHRAAVVPSLLIIVVGKASTATPPNKTGNADDGWTRRMSHLSRAIRRRKEGTSSTVKNYDYPSWRVARNFHSKKEMQDPNSQGI